MAYVLGYLYADGSLEDASYIRGKYVRVSSADKDRVESIRSALCSSHTIVKEKVPPQSKPKYLLRIGSKDLYESLLRCGITPRKSLTMQFPVIPTQFLGAFVRGYFDGDGSVVIDRYHGRPRRLLTVFTSGSKEFLMNLHAHLIELCGVTGGNVYAHGSTKGAYQLRYSTRDSLRLFLLMYPARMSHQFRLRRKYDIFTQYMKLRGMTRKDIPKVLDQKGPMVKW